VTRREVLLLPISPEDARAACRSAVSPEVWELERDTTDLLVAHEWPWRMSCQIRPARLEILIRSAGPQSTLVSLEASSAGIGTLPSRHLRESLEGLAEAIRRRVENLVDHRGGVALG
jgi:hypothetical protein